MTLFVPLASKRLFAEVLIKLCLTFLIMVLLIAAVSRGGGFREGGYRHLYTIFAALLAVIVILFIPQIYQLFQVPVVGVYEIGTFAGILCLFAFLAAIVRLYVGLVFTITPRTESAPVCRILAPEPQVQDANSRAQPHSPPSCLLRGIDEPRLSQDLNGFEQFSELFVRTGERLSVSERRWAGALLALGAVGWLLIPWVTGAREESLFDRPLRCTFFVIAALMVAWLVSIPKSASPEKRMSYVKNLQGRALWYLLATYMLGDIVWAMADANAFSFRVYTLWAFLNILFFPILYARVIDAWHVHSSSGWVRLVGLAPVGAVLVAAALWFAIGPSDVGHPGTSKVDAGDCESAWLDHCEKRLDAIERLPGDGPMVLVAASGGGSRAALFTALMLEALARTDGQGKPLVEPAPKVGDRMHRRIVIISSVSGGSLGAAHYAAQQEIADQPESMLPRRRWRNAIEAELVRDLRDCAEDFYDVQQNRPPETDGLAEERRQRHLEAQKRVRDACQKLYQGQTGAGKDEFPDWLLASAFADDMGMDFMAPLLRGVLHFGLERGASVSRFWEQRFGWDGKTNLNGFSVERTPLLFQNACDVDSGSRLVVGFPQVPPALLRNTEKGAASVTPILELDPTHEFTLAEAVRMSANFPWGFQVARTNAGVAGSAPQTRYIMDGGFVDNTGLDSLAYLLGTLHRLELSDEDNARKEIAGRILDKLRRRGVLLVEIDSGAKVHGRGVAEVALPSLFEPVRCLSNSVDGNANLAADGHVSTITKALTDLHDGKVHFVHARFTCNHVENVMTAWALSSVDKAKIIVQFLTELNYNSGADLNPDGNLATLVALAHTGLDPDKSRQVQQKGAHDANQRKEAYSGMERSIGAQPPNGSKQ
jgi:predicted acylesterase/phospholipase RssA